MERVNRTLHKSDETSRKSFPQRASLRSENLFSRVHENLFPTNEKKINLQVPSKLTRRRNSVSLRIRDRQHDVTTRIMRHSQSRVSRNPAESNTLHQSTRLSPALSGYATIIGATLPYLTCAFRDDRVVSPSPCAPPRIQARHAELAVVG